MAMYEKKAPSGPELLLRSLGLGSVLDMAQSLASSPLMARIIQEDTLTQVLRIPHELGLINERLANIERILAQLGGGTDLEPGTHPDRDNVTSYGARSLVDGRTDLRLGSPGVAGGAPDGRRGGNSDAA